MTRKTRPIACGPRPDRRCRGRIPGHCEAADRLWVRRAGAGVEASRGCLPTTKGGSAMSDDFELVGGSGNVFRDFDMPNPDLEQLRAILAAQIIKALDRKRLPSAKPRKL